MIWKDAYLESRVLTASPVELICLLYQHALESVQISRRCLKAGDIAGRSKAICGALDAIAELTGSLDQSIGGELGRSLAELYLYIRRRLTEGNLRQHDTPLAEAESLLTTLSEAWKGAQAESLTTSTQAPSGISPAGPWQNATTGGAHVWSA
jgi:flagellar protein FliS